MKKAISKFNRRTFKEPSRFLKHAVTQPNENRLFFKMTIQETALLKSRMIETLKAAVALFTEPTIGEQHLSGLFIDKAVLNNPDLRF